MEIRKKLSLQFVILVGLILLFSSTAIYFSFSATRRDDFYDRLGSKATMVAKMLVEIEEINADLLKRIEEDNPSSLPNEKIVIYDYQNQVIYSSDEEGILDISQEMIDNVRLNENMRTKQGNYEILGLFYTGQYDRFVVFSAAMDIFGLKKLRLLGIIELSVFLFSLIIAFISGNIFARRALKPISDIMGQVNAIGGSNLDIRISEGNGRDELSRLAATFNKLLDRLEDTFRTQKSFIANASHEMRTPLTAVTLQLEVTLINARKNEEYRNTIISVLEDIKNLNQVSNRLLLLAQTSSEFTENSFTRVRIDDIVWQARKEVLKRDPVYSIHASFSESIDNENKLTTRGSELLLRTALGNLMDNACKYSMNHTADINMDFTDGRIEICVKDSGIGIPEQELEYIFQPFFRAHNTMGYKGHGIGLSLVHRIIQLHQASIEVHSELGRGTNIKVFLPPSSEFI